MLNIGVQSVLAKVLNEVQHDVVALRHRQYVKVLMKREHTWNQPKHTL